MVYKRSAMRYAHSNGYTAIVYTTNGEHILTCGSDGDMRCWLSVDDDDPTSHCLGEFVNCIAHDGEALLASSDHNTVQRYTFPAMDKDGTLLRFTAPVTCLRAIQNAELFVAAGSEDSTIKILRKNNTAMPIDLEGHAGPVLALDVSLKHDLLASIAGDGELRIWNISNGGSCIKSIKGLTRVNSFEAAICYGTPVFEPSQQRSLAYVQGQEVVILNTSTWEVKFTLRDDQRFSVLEEQENNDTSCYTCCSFSHDGLLLAAGTSDGHISIFDFARQNVLRSEEPASDCRGICSLAWHPKHNQELAYCDISGQLGTVFVNDATNGGGGSGISAKTARTNTTNADEPVDFGDLIFTGSVESDDHNGYHDDVDDDIGHEDDGDEDNENCVSLEKLKNRVMATASLAADGITPLDVEIDDQNTRDSLGKDSIVSDLPSDKGNLKKMFKQQVAFQPTATPTHLDHRYMVWNEIGVVTAHADNVDGSIDVEFHDANIHHALHIPNYASHTMAALSSTILALAAADNTKLVCIALAASGNKEWSIDMPDCEGIKALAVARHLVGVATSAQFVRLFTAMGTQREILTLPGPVVAMAGHEDALLVAYHCAPSSDQQQYMAVLWLRCENGLLQRMRNDILPLPLVAGRQLIWLGFSDNGSPAFHDTMGLLQLYSSRTKCWHPICDTLKRSSALSNNYFVVAVSERRQMVQAVLCRGSTYPMTNPRPMLQELEMRLPLADDDEERARLEDTLVRSHIMPDADGSKKAAKEAAIKLFALSCRSEMEARAKELIEMIACPELLELAVKYATKLGRIHLADRMVEMRSQMEEQQQEISQLERITTNDSFSVFCSPSSRPETPTSVTTKLAPKPIELNQGRRSVLKRFAQTQNAGNRSTSNATSERSISPSSINTQENIFGDEMMASSEFKDQQLKSSVDDISATNIGRSPLNMKNPFAMKRKLETPDFLCSGNGFANKLKMPKK